MGHNYPLSGRSCFTAIYGDPVEHSLSPAMHNAAYAALGIERAYLAFRVRPEHLRAALRAIPAMGILGVNLTVPHKQQALRMVAEVSDEGRLLGAINCVVNRDGMLYGDNTDARGLEADLRENGIDLPGRLAIIVGAGGAAASAILACLRLGTGRIIICNRTEERAAQLARRFERQASRIHDRPGQKTILVHPLAALNSAELLADTALIINATSLSLTSDEFATLNYSATPGDCLFYDLTYAREATPFLRPAMALGRRALDGAGMLANQGELAFALFNGLAPPAGRMRTTLMAALGRT